MVHKVWNRSGVPGLLRIYGTALDSMFDRPTFRVVRLSSFVFRCFQWPRTEATRRTEGWIRPATAFFGRVYESRRTRLAPPFSTLAAPTTFGGFRPNRTAEDRHRTEPKSSPLRSWSSGPSLSMRRSRISSERSTAGHI